MSTDYAFLAVDSSGVAHCWGLDGYGGLCDSVGNLNGFNLYSSSTVFAAINTATGAGRCWGQESYGGSCSTLDFTGVTDVWANSRAFVAVDSNSQNVQAWGASAQGADVSGVDFSQVLTLPTTVTQTVTGTTVTATSTQTGTTVTATNTATTETHTATQTTATVTVTGTTVNLSVLGHPGSCHFICRWFLRSERMKPRVCGLRLCTGCDQCGMETTTTTTTTTEEMPVCADVCKQYKGSAANGGWTSMAFLCVQEKKNGNHKCYPPSPRMKKRKIKVPGPAGACAERATDSGSSWPNMWCTPRKRHQTRQAPKKILGPAVPGTRYGYSIAASGREATLPAYPAYSVVQIPRSAQLPAQVAASGHPFFQVPARSAAEQRPSLPSRPFAMEATETMERSLRPSNLNASISATSRQWTHPWPSMTGGGMASPTLTASRFVAPPRVTYVQTQSDLQRPVSMLLPASAPASAPAAPPAKRATAPATLTAPALAAPMMPRASMPAARYGTSYPATAWTMPSVRTMPAHAAPGHACRAYGLAPASQVAMQAQARFPLPVCERGAMDTETVDKAYQLCRKLDTERDGALVFSKLQAVLKEVCPEADDEEIKTLISSVDLNGDGLVQYEEFLRWLRFPPTSSGIKMSFEEFAFWQGRGRPRERRFVNRACDVVLFSQDTLKSGMLDRIKLDQSASASDPTSDELRDPDTADKAKKSSMEEAAV
eukprot:g28293.t1